MTAFDCITVLASPKTLCDVSGIAFKFDGMVKYLFAYMFVATFELLA